MAEKTMSLGPIMLDLEGVELSAEERELLAHPLVGGVILFTRNYVSPEQLTALVADIHAVRSPRLLVAVDHEGGRVQRFREGFTRLPPVGRLGELYARDRIKGLWLSRAAGWLMASELRACDVDFSFAPVLDLDFGVSEVIGDRAFHRSPEIVTSLAHAYMAGMQEAGMAATGKHFPGHGGVAADSHIDIPVDERSYADLSEDIAVFERMVTYGLAAVMPAHVIYPRVDANPAGFSRIWLQDILRQRLRFQGVIFSDDLSMAGATVAGADCAARGRAALAAGCDMVLVCNDRAGAIQVLEGLGAHNDPAAHLRLARMHGRHQVTRDEVRADPRWRQAVSTLARYEETASLKLEL